MLVSISSNVSVLTFRRYFYLLVRCVYFIVAISLINLLFSKYSSTVATEKEKKLW